MTHVFLSRRLTHTYSALCFTCLPISLSSLTCSDAVILFTSLTYAPTTLFPPSLIILVAKLLTYSSTDSHTFNMKKSCPEQKPHAAGPRNRSRWAEPNSTPLCLLLCCVCFVSKMLLFGSLCLLLCLGSSAKIPPPLIPAK